MDLYLPVENIVPFVAPNVEHATEIGMSQAITPNTRCPQVCIEKVRGVNYFEMSILYFYTDVMANT